MTRINRTKPVSSSWFSPGKVIREFDTEGRHVILRYPRRDDAADLMRCLNSIIREKAPVGRQKKVTLSEERKWLSIVLGEMEKGRKAEVFAESDGRIVGTGGVTRNPLDANSHVCGLGINVIREYRGKGIGKMLMEILLQHARDALGCSLVELSYVEGNVAARRLYDGLGFREAGRIPKRFNDYGKLRDEVIMVKELA
jgi:putative acetyltransferase